MTEAEWNNCTDPQPMLEFNSPSRIKEACRRMSAHLNGSSLAARATDSMAMAATAEP
jgi:hypothetical protein